MQKMKFESVNMTERNIEKIGELFPNCITETKDENGKLKKAVNFEMLRKMLSDDVAEGDEAYEFTWVGKKASIVEANKPTRKTLRPCKEESVDWDNTENLYIEGDNLEVLKLLQESYLGKVKMIYIDPPYNTGNDFIYNDDFKMTSEEYAEESGEINEDGDRMFKNTDSNGRFHSDWCSMIYPRLLLARNLLSDDGVIFISIDDNEQENLKKICDEVFGAKNFVAQLIWQNKKGGGNDSKHIAIEHEYILVYALNIYLLDEFYEKYTDDYIRRYKETDEIGKYFWDTFKRKSGKQYYPITCPDGTVLEYDEDGNAISWLRSKSRFDADVKSGEIRIVKLGEKWSVQFKQRMPLGKTPRSIFTTETVLLNNGTTSSGASDLYRYFKKNIFSNPKPTDLIRFLSGFCLNKNDILLDFFSGSATTAHAVMQLNAGDGGNRKFIMVQLPEKTDEKSEAYKAGYENICEIGKERIRRVGERIKYEIEISAPMERAEQETGIATAYIDEEAKKYGKEVAKDFDGGFRVFKLDESNMKDVYYSANEYSQDLLDQLESNIREDRNDLDLFFGCLLEWGLPLSLPYTSEDIDGYTVHTYNEGDLIACFDEDISESVIKEIAKRQPLRAVFRDSGFSDSPAKINVSEIFKMLAPDTRVKVI